MWGIYFYFNFTGFLWTPRIWLGHLVNSAIAWYVLTLKNSNWIHAEIQNAGDAVDAVSANLFHLCYFFAFAINFTHFCTICFCFWNFCKFLHNFGCFCAFFCKSVWCKFFRLKVVSVLFFKLFATLKSVFLHPLKQICI